MARASASSIADPEWIALQIRALASAVDELNVEMTALAMRVDRLEKTTKASPGPTDEQEGVNLDEEMAACQTRRQHGSNRT